jgi:hypothetical protein
MIKKILLFTLATLHLYSNQNSVGIDINSKDVEVLTSINIHTLSTYSDGTTYMFDASYLNADGDNLLTLGVSAKNMMQGIEDLSLSFGLRAAMASDFLSFPLYAKADYRLPLIDTIPPTYLSASFAYAPSVLSFRDAKSYKELRVEVDMEVISNIHIFTGFRHIGTDYDTYNRTFNSSLYVGFKLSF